MRVFARVSDNDSEASSFNELGGTDRVLANEWAQASRG